MLNVRKYDISCYNVRIEYKQTARHCTMCTHVAANRMKLNRNCLSFSFITASNRLISFLIHANQFTENSLFWR